MGKSTALYANLVSGRSSVVEHHLAKVKVVGSNLIARSRFFFEIYVEQKIALEAMSVFCASKHIVSTGKIK